MALHLKVRFFRRYLALRDWSARFEAATFARLSRVVTGIHVRPLDVQLGAYARSREYSKLQYTVANLSPETLALARDLFEESRSRVNAVMAKVATLLTVTSIAVSGTLTSLSLIGVPSRWYFHTVFLVTMVIFLLTGWVLFKFIGIGRTASPGLNQELLDLPESDIKRALIRDLLAAMEQNDARNNFLVDVYKVGRRLCALSFACALMLLTLAVGDRIGREDRLILKLRGDPHLVELLRGPKGTGGEPGHVGPAGPPGEKGTACLPPIECSPFDYRPNSLLEGLWILTPPEQRTQSTDQQVATKPTAPEA